MAFTTQSDINVLQTADATNIGAGVGNDIYILSQHVPMTANKTISISDIQGTNTLQLLNGLSIANFSIAKTSLQLKLVNDFNNSFTVNVFGADKFMFDVGGNIVSGIDNPDVSFQQFVTDVLGKTVPTTPEVVTGESITIGAAASMTETISIPVGSTDPVIATAADETFSLALDGATGAYATTANTQVTLSDFDAAADSLRFDLPATIDLPAGGVNSLDDLNGVAVDATRVIAVSPDPFTGSTVINFGTDGNGDLVTLTLAGIVDPATVEVSIV